MTITMMPVFYWSELRLNLENAGFDPDIIYKYFYDGEFLLKYRVNYPNEVLYYLTEEKYFGSCNDDSEEWDKINEFIYNQIKDITPMNYVIIDFGG